MLAEITEQTYIKFSKILNNDSNDIKDYRLVGFIDRSVRKIIKLIICTEKEWLTFYQFCMSSEYMKSKIDIIFETYISKDTRNKMLEILSVRKEIFYENFEIFNSNIITDITNRM